MREKLRGVLDSLTGRKEEMLLRYSRLNEFDRENIVLKRKNELLKFYLLILAAALVLSAVYAVQMKIKLDSYEMSKGKVISIERDEEKSKTVDITAEVNNEKKNMTLTIDPQADGEEEKPAEKETESVIDPDYWDEIADADRE